MATRVYERFRGDWAPGHFDPWVTLSCKLLLYMLMAVRGADYLSPESMARLALVEAALPLHLWGLALLVAAERDLLAAWSVFVSRWWHDKERALAEKGIDVPPPPWPAFQNWLDDITQRQNEETRP